MNKRRTGRWLPLALALTLAAVAALPLLEPGFLNTRGGGDSPFLLQRLQQLEAAARGGHFPARWMPDANYGFGYPFFNFYAPLSIYVALFFRLLGFGYVHALELAQLSGFLVAGAGAFHVGRRWWGSSAAGVLTAAAYTLAPFHLVNVYVRGDSLAEFWAMAFFPLTVAAMDRLLDDVGTARRWQGSVVLLALSYAGLVLSHNISALIFSPFLLLYGLLRLNRPVLPRLARLAAGAALGLLLSAWFWLPALAESGGAQTGPITSGYFNYINHFRGADLVQGDLLFDYDVSDGGAFRMGLVQALLSAAGAGAALWLRRRGSIAASGPRFALLAFVIATFMITPFSQALWDHLPLLPFTQFPWRFLSIQAFGGALLIGALARLPRPHLAAAAAIALLLLSSLGKLRTDELRLTDADINAARLAEYEWFTGNIGTTVSAEYLPGAALPRPFNSAWLTNGDRRGASVTAGTALVTFREGSAARQTWDVEVRGEIATVLLPLLYWPGWTAATASNRVALTAAESGLAQVTLPRGAHTLQLRLTRTPLRLAAELLSLLACAAALVLAAPALRRLPWRPVAAGTAALLVLAAAAWLWPTSALDPETLSWDFAQQGYLHHQPDGITFGGGPRLSAYEFEADAIAAGSEWSIILRWADAPPAGSITVSLEQPGVTRFPTAPTVASVTAALTESMTLTLPIPAEAPAGLFLPHLALRDADGNLLLATTTTGAARGALFLRPLRITRAASDAVAGETRLTVRAVDVRQRDLQTLDVRLAWATPRALSANYAASLRLVDSGGITRSQLDVQPGYGYLPTTGWPAGAWVNDWLALPLPEVRDGLPPYSLVARLYEVEGGSAVLVRRLGQVSGPAGDLRFEPTPPQFALPTDLTPVGADFGGIITLPGYQIDQKNRETLALTLFWQARAPIADSYRHFVHVVEPATGAIVAQHDALPQNDSYPTDQWSGGEVVADPVRLDLRDVPAGTYTVLVGLYRPEGNAFVRLPALGAAGTPVPDDALFLFELTLE